MIEERAMNKETNSKKQGYDVAQHRSSIYNLFILALIVFSFIVMAGLLLGTDIDQIIYHVDVLISAVLFADFLSNLWRAPNIFNYFFRAGGWLDLLGSIPAVPGYPWTSLFHLARLNQVVRIGRHLRGEDRAEMVEENRQTPAKTAMLTITIAGFVLITIASILILWLEGEATGVKTMTGADAFWWVVVTITSIPYGEYVPISFSGRSLAIVLRFFGFVILAALTTYFAERLLELRVSQQELVKTIQDENAIILTELAELKALWEQHEEKDGDQI